MVKQTCFFAAAMAFLSAFSLAAEDVDLSIRFYDKKVYHISGPSGEPIYVQVTLTNRSPRTYRFKLADERVFSIDFDIRNLSNQSLEPADYILRKRSESRNVYFREIIVESGESFSFVEDIRNYAALREAGSFVVQARIFPELFREDSGSPGPLESNRLSLHLLPPALPGPDGIPFEMDVETNALLVREKLPPDEIVAYMLTARQKSQWEKFFLYMDLEAMITNDAVRRRTWLAESGEGRRRMMAKYKEDLKNSVADEDIALIPSEFRIENTSYSGETGSVVVTEWFQTGRITERRRYTYSFRKHDDIWTIQNYTVVRLGTE
ncbi:MAG: hypothetical protein LBP60_08065 [Spirochaetaceae bacterium]|jgi:hypothetical protein|nr:hypothetical protein [Spirochaetaceae bacterium]